MEYTEKQQQTQRCKKGIRCSLHGVINAPAAIRYMTAARMTDGVPPATGTKSRIIRMDTQVPMRRPSSR